MILAESLHLKNAQNDYNGYVLKRKICSEKREGKGLNLEGSLSRD